MIASGIVDPTKVTRSSLENAASIAGCVLTTESLVVDKPDPAADAAAAAAVAQQTNITNRVNGIHSENTPFGKGVIPSACSNVGEDARIGTLYTKGVQISTFVFVTL